MKAIIVLYHDDLITSSFYNEKINLSEYDEGEDWRRFEFLTDTEANAFIRALDEHDWAFNYAIVSPDECDFGEEEEEPKKFEVTYFYHTMATVTVEAETKEEAISKGYNHISNEDLLANMQEEYGPDVEEC